MIITYIHQSRYGNVNTVGYQVFYTKSHHFSYVYLRLFMHEFILINNKTAEFYACLP